jgi:hypothetical protein
MLRSKYSSLLVISILLIVTNRTFAIAEGWTLKQVSNSSLIIPGGLDISGSNIVWTEYDENYISQVMLWDGNSLRQISSGTNNCVRQQISGNNVVWTEYINDIYHIMFWNGGSPVQISSDVNSCDYPQISGNNVVWTEYINGKSQVIFWNGATRVQISSDVNSCDYPQISGNNVVWAEDINKRQIMFWNGGTPLQISGGTNYCYNPQISGNNVVWGETINDTIQIMFWNGGTPIQISIQISSDVNSLDYPQISGNNVVWTEYNNGTSQIMFWDGTTVSRLTNNLKYKMNPYISGKNVVWSECPSPIAFPPPPINYLFLFDGNSTSKVYDGFIGSSVISENNIAFLSYDENYDVQVFLLQPSTPKPVTIPLISDLNKDNKVDFNDFAIFASEWLQEGKTRIIRYSLDFNPNWTTQGQWQFGKPMGMGGVEFGYPDPLGGFSGSNVYGVNLFGDYSTSVGGPYYLTAGPFDCTGYTNVELSFRSWLNTDNSDYVKCKIEVSNDGTIWETIWQNPSGSEITNNSWNSLRFNIGSIADNRPLVSVRWSYQVLNVRALPYSGWNIDDVELWGR